MAEGSQSPSNPQAATVAMADAAKDATDYEERADLAEAPYSVAHSLEGHSRAVASVRFSHSGACLASASADATARIWRTDTGECLRILRGHSKVGPLRLSWGPVADGWLFW